MHAFRKAVCSSQYSRTMVSNRYVRGMLKKNDIPVKRRNVIKFITFERRNYPMDTGFWNYSKYDDRSPGGSIIRSAFARIRIVGQDIKTNNELQQRTSVGYHLGKWYEKILTSAGIYDPGAITWNMCEVRRWGGRRDFFSTFWPRE